MCYLFPVSSLKFTRRIAGDTVGFLRQLVVRIATSISRNELTVPSQTAPFQTGVLGTHRQMHPRSLPPLHTYLHVLVLSINFLVNASLHKGFIAQYTLYARRFTGASHSRTPQ